MSSTPTIDEKQVGVSTDVSNSDGYQSDVERDWSDAEEKKLVRKLDFIVLALLTLAFFALQIDRGNIGNALTDNFLKDVGITQYQFNVGQQLLSLGIVLLEIPSNIVLYKLGPTIWIGGQIIAWGLVATFQAFQHGLGPYLATRLLLGLCEAGFIPAGLYTITRWYKRDETSKRFSVFFLGNMLAGACTGLVAYGILHMRGVRGLAGWQWLFLIEGMITVAIGILFITFFPKSPSNPVSILGIRYFNEREVHILSRRVLLDDPSKIHTHTHISKQEIKNALTNWRLIPHVILTISALSPASTMMSYAPTLVASFGYPKLKANAMTSIGAWMLLITNVSWGFISDRYGRRGLMVFLGMLIYWGFQLGNRLAIHSANSHLRFGLLVTSVAFGSNWHPVNGSWMASNAKSAGERSITLAIFIMSANTSGIVGSQLLQAKDSPLYKTGWTVMLALVSVGLVMSVIANVQYYLLNKKKQREQPGIDVQELYKI
ncbi:transporter [Sporothrix schenckii 1099-18]|uniref:Transporter n=1 Tax=Sporothrix schenckii 1099-18 TaxID=1397361 RepID=A0A0F2MLJ8_SPOSC|nr:transporter [Sporothrix schenckii 1099-18]KJR89056.1 transporter [Sporothrix schenckii 1099-18]